MIELNETAYKFLADRYPVQEVADHEVLLSFNNDDDGLDFRDWLEEAGFEQFKAWQVKRYVP